MSTKSKNYDTANIMKTIKDFQAKFKNHHLTEYIKDKNVCIVGPDTSLQGMSLGKEIDRYDVIIRHNTVFDFLPFTEEYKKDYGSRTDILYLSPTCIKTYALKKEETRDKISKLAIKYIIYQNGNKDNLYITGDYCFPKSLEWFKTQYKISSNTKNSTNTKKDVKTHASTKLHYSHHTTEELSKILTFMNEKSPIVPRTGMISVYDMLVHGANNIYIVGMSFYNGGGHAFRKDVKQELDPLKDHKGNKSPHNSVVEVDLLTILLNAYPSEITLGPPLEAESASKKD